MGRNKEVEVKTVERRDRGLGAEGRAPPKWKPGSQSHWGERREVESRGSDSPAQPSLRVSRRSLLPASLPSSLVRFLPGPLRETPSSVRVSAMVRWFLHLAPGFGLWLSLPTWPSRWAVLLTPRPQGGLLVKRCREGGVQPASESQIGCGGPEAGRRRSRPGGGRGGWGPAQSPGRSHCFPARSRGGSGGCDWDPRLARPDSGRELRSGLHPIRTLITSRQSPNHGLRTRRGAGLLPARCDLGPADPDLGASTPELGEMGLQGRPGGRGTPQLGTTFRSARGNREGASALCAWLVERVSGVGVLGGRRGPWPSPVSALLGAASGLLFPPGFSESRPLDWGARKGII